MGVDLTTKSRTFLVLTLLFLSTGRKISPIQINTFLLQRVLGLQVAGVSFPILPSQSKHFAIWETKLPGFAKFFSGAKPLSSQLFSHSFLFLQYSTPEAIQIVSFRLLTVTH